MTTKAQRKTQEDTRPHRHECERNPHGDDGRVCHERGYHRCACGATCGVAESSVWIKSHAEKGAPGWWI